MSLQLRILYAIAVLAFASAILMLIVDPGWGARADARGVGVFGSGHGGELAAARKDVAAAVPRSATAGALATEAHRPVAHPRWRCAARLGALAFDLASLNATPVG